MELRFRYGKIDSNFEYSDSQLAKIDVHLDEDQIRQQLADGYKGCLSGLGRKPLDSVIGYKAHLLYFLKRDIISFNELPKQIAKDAVAREFESGELFYLDEGSKTVRVWLE